MTDRLQAPKQYYILPSGYRHIRWSAERWAQWPPSFSGEIISDDYIFHPEWNREAINDWWKRRKVGP